MCPQHIHNRERLKNPAARFEGTLHQDFYDENRNISRKNSTKIANPAGAVNGRDEGCTSVPPLILDGYEGQQAVGTGGEGPQTAPALP